jgi:hypothetical protein
MRPAVMRSVHASFIQEPNVEAGENLIVPGSL